MLTGVGGADTIRRVDGATFNATGASGVSSTALGASGASPFVCIPTASSIACNLS